MVFTSLSSEKINGTFRNSLSPKDNKIKKAKKIDIMLIIIVPDNFLGWETTCNSVIKLARHGIIKENNVYGWKGKVRLTRK